MRTSLRTGLMLVLTTLCSWGTSIQFTGTVNSAAGVYSFLNGANLSGTVQAEVGPDLEPTDPTFGVFLAQVGLFSLTAGPITFQFEVPGPDSPEILIETNYSEVIENIRFVASIEGITAEVVLSGYAGFLTSDEFPGGVNWSLFASGTGSLTNTIAVLPTADFGIPAEGDQFLFTISSVSDVPEPGSIALVGAGLISAAMFRRRFSR